jgi:transposase
MTTRRRFSADFKAKVALEALRGDKTIQEIATRHKVHPNQVSTWKRQAMDGLGAVFSNGPDKTRMDHDDEVHDLHAKIGQELLSKVVYGLIKRRRDPGVLRLRI